MTDANSARDALAKRGIAVHVASTEAADPQAPAFIDLSVDNRALDAARRAIAAWRTGNGARGV